MHRLGRKNIECLFLNSLPDCFSISQPVITPSNTTRQTQCGAKISHQRIAILCLDHLSLVIAIGNAINRTPRVAGGFDVVAGVADVQVVGGVGAEGGASMVDRLGMGFAVGRGIARDDAAEIMGEPGSEQ